MSKSYIIWDPSYSVNNQLLDSQHQKILELLNELFQTVSAGENVSLNRIIDAMIDYSLGHLNDEEKILERIKYKDYEVHRAAHQQMRYKSLEVKEQLRVGSTDLQIDILHFLKDWWLNHILKMDHLYADSIRGI
ncbi:MAG: bacteriohemerythrin [Candidatus Margulisbacteria bacterium]|nr:bacteriohemerythrin [Candidatus Margulisiibacteriota bacterium]